MLTPLWLLVVLGFPLCLCYCLWTFLQGSVMAGALALRPRTPGTADSRIRPAPGGEPAAPSYWTGQVWTDALLVWHAAGRALWGLLRWEFLDRRVRRMLRGEGPVTGYRRNTPGSRLLLRLLAPGVALAAAVSALVATALMAVVMLCFWLLLGLVALPVLAGIPAGRAADGLWKLALGVRMKCPYPGCYRPFRLAVYPCPGCGAAHRELRPGRFGAWRHVCRCGRALPATAVTGRRKLAARCPHCDRSLPAAVGTARVVHVPLVGATSAGKTMLLAAMVAGLRSWAHSSRLTVAYATAGDQQDVNALDLQLRRTGWAHKTQGGQPRALMLLVGNRWQRRLLYLYDPMGESMREAGTVRQQQYLAHADGVVLVADVLAAREVRRRLDDADRRRAEDARPADTSPVDTYAALAGELQGQRGRMGAAVVVTKRDVLDTLGSLPVPGARTEEWLGAVGLDGLVRELGHGFAAARYWTVSAYAATGTAPLPGEQRRAAEPLLWLLARSGLRGVPRESGTAPRTARAAEGDGG
ncbi:hypothetical protein [Streptomyces sp. NPDC012888]|uniref:TRAFAC clade GTPase domain-containing protein n=1 Tax=Streptomyces sp. NPDC012888 TaxID=3364855 RepID=UPI0036A16467